MALKASAHSEPRGALCSISCQPSAAEFCSPTRSARLGQPPIACTPSALVPVQSAHSAHVAECADCTGGCADGLLSSGGYHKSGACANIGVTVDGKVVVGRRLHHRAGVHRRRPQGQSSPLWPQRAAAWPLVPHSRTLERPTLGSVRSFSP